MRGGSWERRVVSCEGFRVYSSYFMINLGLFKYNRCLN